MDFGFIHFPGITKILGGNFSLTTGVVPSVAVFDILPQTEPFPQVGNLVISDGNNIVTFYDCLAEYATLSHLDSGIDCKLIIKDRRWRWEDEKGGGTVSVYNNLLDDSHTVQQYYGTNLTLKEMLKYCFDRLGETNVVLDYVPDVRLDETKWDFDLPANAISDLCDDWGLVVVLGIDNIVYVGPLGIGWDVPVGPIEHDEVTLIKPVVPNRMVAVCSPTRFQVDFVLEAVGVENDIDGTIKPINELSYKPTGPLGWALDLPPNFDSVEQHHGEAAKKLAQSCIYKMYRITSGITYFIPSNKQIRCQLCDGIPIPGLKENNWNLHEHELTNFHYTEDPKDLVTDSGLMQIYSRWQVVLEDTQVETYLDPESNIRVSRPAVIFGIFMDPDGWNLTNTIVESDYYDPPIWPEGGRKGVVYNYPWRIDKKNRLIKFDDPIYRNTRGETTEFISSNIYTIQQPENVDKLVVGPAILVLRTGCTLLDSTCAAPLRYIYSLSGSEELVTGYRYFPAEELSVGFFPQYNVGGTIAKVVNNIETIRPLANTQIQGMLSNYIKNNPRTLQYVGIMPIGLDGVTLNVTWILNDSGFTTKVSQYDEQFEWTPRRKERSYAERVKKIGLESKKSKKTKKQEHKGVSSSKSGGGFF